MPTILGRTMSQRDGFRWLDRYDKLFTTLWSQRSPWDDLWREVADVILPTRTRFFMTDRNQASGTRNEKIIDNTGKLAQRTLGAGLHSGMTSPARPWMKLSTPDPSLAEFPPVKEWLHVVTQRMLAVFQQSNLYNTLPTLYSDLGTFGTAAMSMLEDHDDLFRCYTYPLGSFAMGLDQRRKVGTFVHEFQMTVRQVVEQFGVVRGYRDIDWSRISPTTKRHWDNGEYEHAVDVCWVVMPNEQFDPNRLEARFKRWVSVHYEKGNTGPDATMLRESGFDTFPLMCPRWDVTGNDTYGSDCPGITAAGDVKQLQVEQRRKGQLLSKAIDPPLKGPSSLRNRKISLLPGDFTADDARNGQQGLQPIHEVRLEGFQHVTVDIQEVQRRIERAFYADLWLMLTQPDPNRGTQPITAREVQERHEEKLVILGPVLGRMDDELLEPIVDRAYAIMDRYGLIPPPPPDLIGVKLKVEFTSILHQAQRLIGVSGQDRFVTSVAGMAEVAPAVLEKVDWLQVVDNYADMLGVDPRIVVPSDVARQRIAEAAQRQAAAEQAEQAALLAKGARDASQANMGGGRNALQEVVGR